MERKADFGVPKHYWHGNKAGPLGKWANFQKCMLAVEKHLGRPPESGMEISRVLGEDGNRLTGYAWRHHGKWPGVFQKMGWPYKDFGDDVQAAEKLGNKFLLFENLAVRLERLGAGERGKLDLGAVSGGEREKLEDAIAYHGGPDAVSEFLKKRRENMGKLGAEKAAVLSRALRGDGNAKNEVARQYDALVRSIARSLPTKPLGLGDLEGSGFLGLAKALRKYNFHGSLPTTYFTPLVKGEMQRAIRDASPAKRGYGEIWGAYNELLSDGGKLPSDEEVAQRSGHARELVQRVLAGSNVSLDLLRELGVEPSETPGTDDSIHLAGLLQNLDERTRRILFSKFRLGRTQNQIAAAEGISQMHVSRLIRKGIKKMREEHERTSKLAKQQD